jgi:DNA-binding MarR family transcriptional regulator
VVDRAKCAEIASTCACFNFRKASRAVTQFYDEILQPSGLRSTQFVILVGVSLHEPVQMAPLSRALATDRTTLTRNLGPLSQRGFLRTKNGGDGRTRVVSLTPLGRRTLAEAIAYWENAQARFVRQFGPRRWRSLLLNLAAAVDAIGKNRRTG